jgi:hypothetical protein
MAMRKEGHATIAELAIDPFKWVEKKASPSRIKVAKDLVAQYDPGKWLLSHATIIASVDVDTADQNNPKGNYWIKPEYSIFVNNNGDSWERELLKKCYQTFVGSDNYVEHVQIPELSKGKIVDVALREIPFMKSSEGKDLTTLYVDILIATNKKHTDLIDKIKTGEYNAMSMGCLIEYSQCSQCGRIAKDESESCDHIRYFKKNYFYDPNGIKRIIAELCGRAEDPGSCKFIEASWVKKPAFEGAVLRNIVEPTAGFDSKFQVALGMPSYVAKPGDILRAASDAAAKLIRELEAQDKKEEEPAPAADDAGFPEAPAEKDAPVEEDTGEGVPLGDLAGAPPEGAPDAGGAPAEGQPEVPVPEGDASVKEVKDLLKRQVLNEIRDELYKKQPGSKAGPEDRPVGLENASNDSLVKEASYSRVVKAAKETGSDRLVNGLLIMSNLKDWSKLKRYGYTKSDVLGMLHFIDKTASSNPLSKDIIKSLSVTKDGSDLKSFFTEIIVETGKKLSSTEARKLASWKQILDKVK